MSPQDSTLRLAQSTVRDHHQQVRIREGSLLCQLQRLDRSGVTVVQEALRDGVKGSTEGSLPESITLQNPQSCPDSWPSRPPPDSTSEPKSTAAVVNLRVAEQECWRAWTLDLPVDGWLP